MLGCAEDDIGHIEVGTGKCRREIIFQGNINHFFKIAAGLIILLIIKIECAEADIAIVFEIEIIDIVGQLHGSSIPFNGFVGLTGDHKSYCLPVITIGFILLVFIFF